MSNDTPPEKRWYGRSGEQAAPANSANEWINLPGGGSQLRTYRQGGLVWEHAPPLPSDQASRWYGNGKKP
jgi:hypothetical protein